MPTQVDVIEANIVTLECRTLHGCSAGDAKMTKGYAAKHVIHTVDPVWHGGTSGEAQTLASSYRRSLEVAVPAGLKTVAFPSISTGVYGDPLDRAATVAVSAVTSFIEQPSTLERVIFCTFNASATDAIRQALHAIQGSRS